MSVGYAGGVLLALLLACVPPEGDDSAPPDDPGDDSAPPDDPAPVDGDGDGHLPPEDCDDRDADVHPGAEERWDGSDDDCDGRVDADGAYAGTVRTTATAIYEGTPYTRTLDCPATLSRVGGVLAATATCTPDPGDDLGVLLLGEHLTLSAEDPLMGGDTWTGDGALTSAAGWSATAPTSLVWTDLERVTLTWTLDTRSLDAAGVGTLTWDGAR